MSQDNNIEFTPEIEITSFAKKGRYFQVAVNLGDKIKFHPDICVECSLYKGSRFREKEWNEILYQNDFRLAWESAVRLLSIRAHCEGDLSIKLQKRKFTKKIINAVVEECKRLGFIDDKLFSKEYTKELLWRGNGIKMIQSKLRTKGLSSELIDEEIENIRLNNLELAAAKTAYKKKAPSLKKEKDPRKKQEKLYRYLYSKGFSYEIIQDVTEQNSEY
jgi:regulatory protein